MNKLVASFIRGACRVRRSAEMLPTQQERALIDAWQVHGGVRARVDLPRALASLAASVAKRLKGGAGEADPDLVQQAQIGMIKAADRLDPDRGFRFSTYAVWWVPAKFRTMCELAFRLSGARIPRNREPQPGRSPRRMPRKGPMRAWTRRMQTTDLRTLSGWACTGRLSSTRRSRGETAR